MVGEGDKVAVLWLNEGKPSGSTEPVQNYGTYIVRFEGGEIVEGWRINDLLSLNMQFGYRLVLPSDAGEE